MLSSHHPLKITKSFLNIPVSKLSACKAHSQWNWDLLLSKECCEAGRLFTGLDADTWHSDYLPSAWARKMWAEITFTSRMTLPPESSDLLKYGTDVRVTEVPFSHCPGSCREWFFDSFLAVMLPQRGAELVRHFLTWATQIFLLEENLRQKDDIWRLCEPPKDTFCLIIILRKYILFKAPFPPPWSAQQLWRNSCCAFLLLTSHRAIWQHSSITAGCEAQQIKLPALPAHCPGDARARPEWESTGTLQGLELIKSKKAFLHQIL